MNREVYSYHYKLIDPPSHHSIIPPRLLQFVHHPRQLLLSIRQLPAAAVVHPEATHDAVHHQQREAIFVVHLGNSWRT